MLRNVEWSEDRSYRTGGDDEPLQFYLDALSNSTSFDLLLGYFSSAAISVLSPGFARFLSSGGTVRMIVNDILSSQDRNAIKRGLDNKDLNTVYDLSDLKGLKSILDEYGTHFFECLAWLIANQKIQIQVIRPKKGLGISHYKSGVFTDGTDTIGFKASCNFTAYGLLENLEELDVFLTWENGRSNKWINSQKRWFEKIYTHQADFVEYVNADDIQIAIKTEFGNKDINELVIQEKDLLEKKKRIHENKKLKKVLYQAEEDIQSIIREPRFPYQSNPREYQKEAYQSWVDNGYKGIFAMATGTGKTITSLNCLLNEYRKSFSYKAIILVPTIALVNQWKKECNKFNFRNIITISSRENWNDTLAFFNTASTLINTSFIVIVTYASFTRNRFQSHFKLLPKETLLIADEAHNIGSPTMLKLLDKIELHNRIGLSATPNRKYDEVGNSEIEKFFNDSPPYIFSYTMRQAIENKPPALCKYKYFPHVVYLNTEELDEYIKISKQLLKYINSETGTYRDCPEVENLLLARKRIIHKAKNKKPIFRTILRKEFAQRKSLKYTLVYVPEGKDPDYTTTEEYIENSEEVSLIDEYTKAISETDYSVLVKQYTAGTKDRDTVLKEFEEGKVHVLTSMKCLDEGVDVPRSELAIFCASTGNPRQFIQRRGRVLRLHNDKTYAVIHDLVVVPKINESDEYYEMEKNLIKKELERVVDFSELSINKMDTYNELKEILDHYDLNLNDFINNN
jgi:superfamily II DNA or RNA helicase